MGKRKRGSKEKREGKEEERKEEKDSPHITPVLSPVYDNFNSPFPVLTSVTYCCRPDA